MTALYKKAANGLLYRRKLDLVRIDKIFRKTDVLVALCLLLLGVFIVLQYKSAGSRAAIQPDSYNTELFELRQRLKTETERTALLLEQREKLQNEYENYIEEYAKEIMNSELEDKLELLRHYRLMAGLTDVSGEGVVITMRDANIKNDADPQLFLIHDMDIIRVLNELKAAGAQAIAINGERILPVSEIMCAGPTVRINRNRYPVPYVIEAIGSSSALASALEKSHIVMLLKEYDISIKIERKSQITISRYFESIDWTVGDLLEVTQ